MAEPKRVYQVWKGNNIFICNGRLVFGPDAKGLVVTLLLITVPVAFFLTFVARNLLHGVSEYEGGYTILLVAIFLTVFVLVMLFLTSAQDPGFIPRNLHPPEGEIPRTKEVVINNRTVVVKYCHTCNLYRPPRCSHCSVCDNCVERFDHHCPWVGQCIGLRNRRWFFLLVSSSTLLCCFVFAMSALYIKLLTDDHGTVWKAMKASPVSVILMAHCFIFFWFVGALTFCQLYLIGTNQTTYENFRYGSESRFRVCDRGLMNNFHEVFCAKVRPGIDFHAYMQENVQENEPTPATSLTPVGQADQLGRDRSRKIEGDQESSGDHPVVLTHHHDVRRNFPFDVCRGDSNPICKLSTLEG